MGPTSGAAGRDRIWTQGVHGCPLVYQYKYTIICTLFITFIIFWYLLIKNCTYFNKMGKIMLAVLDACNSPAQYHCIINLKWLLFSHSYAAGVK